MNMRLVAFYVITLLFAFSLGIAIQHLPTGVSFAGKEKSGVCTGVAACKKSPLSIFSLGLLKKTQEQATPLGYCLKVPVLLYHHVQPQADAVAKGQTSLTVDNGIFDQQMAYIASHGYTTISASQLINAIVSHGSLPGKPMVLTFDDAYLDNFMYVYPILQKYHLIGNLMVPTGLLGNNSGTNSYYSWDQLAQMVTSGTFFAYDHTWSHYALAAGPADKDTFEIKTGQDQLRAHLGHTDPIFVYPYGSGANISWVWQLLKNNGFVAAFSTLPGIFQCDSNIFALPRLHIGNLPLSSYGL